MDQAEVRRLFFRALEIGLEQQTVFLDAATISDETRQAVRMLLRYDRGAESILDHAVAREQGSAEAGDRFGVYELRQLLGRGGMGAVFKAERTDGELRQVVAIKILEYARLDPKAVERFRRERQILAGLEHPHIARLIDGGTRQDDVPYLVMEYVDGLPIDRYCDQHKMDIAGRLRVFLPVCDAVACAHSSLVVHRDLKPANILVNSAGEAKLLDFGVATVLASGGVSEAQTLALTPHFASPEQARGEPVTTATDIYGLGAVLYHLLTGQAPHDPKDSSMVELQRAICETEPVRPGLIRPELRGDLENILRKALHTDPARRYRHAGDLAEDIQRYLDHRPVLASPDTLWYRSSRLLQRHRVAATAGLLAIFAIALGVGVALYEGRQAEKRFGQVRGLANKFLFDFESSIRDLPGALPARRMIAGTAREYLQSLAIDARRDAGLSRELAESHLQLAKVEFDLGQSDAAIADLEKALALHKAVQDDCCGPPAQRLNYVKTLDELSRVRNMAHGIKEAFALSTEAVRVSREWKQTAPQEPLAERALVDALTQYGGRLETAGQPTEAIKVLTEAVDRAAPLVQQNPQDQELMYTEATAAYFVASLCATQNQPEKARDYAARARDLLDRLLKSSPENTRWRRLRILTVSTSASAFRLLARTDKSFRPQALENAKAAYELAKEDARKDPHSISLADNAVVMTQRWAGHLREAERSAEAVPLLEEAAAEIEALIVRDPKSQRYRYLRQNNRSQLGLTLLDLKRWQQADDALAQQERYLAETLAQEPNDAVTLENQVGLFCYQAMAKWHLGQSDKARERIRRGLDLAASMIRKDPSMENYLGTLQELRSQAKEYGVPDPTLQTAKADSGHQEKKPQ